MAASSETGGDFLERKSGTTKQRLKLPHLNDVLVVDDSETDTNRLIATLRVIFGYDLNIRTAATLAIALDRVIEAKPDLIFLDDVLKPSDSATETIPYLRHANYEGAIIVISGQVTRSRQAELRSCGATEIIHKDDVDSVRLSEALITALGDSAAS